MNIWHLVRNSIEKNYYKDALNSSRGFITYGQLGNCVSIIANKIKDKARTGSRVVILSNNQFVSGVATLSVLAAESTVVPLSLNYGEITAYKIIEKVDPDIIITNELKLPTKIAELVNKNQIKLFILPEDEILNSTNHSEISVTADHSNEIAFIMFTSGTTGEPKGVVLTQQNIMSNIRDINAYFPLIPHDHVIITRPLFHVSAMTGEFLYSLINGVKINFFNGRFSPKKIINFLYDNKATVTFATPTFFYHLTLQQDTEKLNQTLKKVALSGECLSSTAINIIAKTFPEISFYNVYGLTEASPRVTYLSPEMFLNKKGSVGLPLNSVQVRVVNEEGEECIANTLGEIHVSGPNVMKGYWQEANLTEKKIVNGWLITGDIGYLDEDGYLFVLGRKDNMIIRAGVNIYPLEIENALLDYSLIKEAVVYGEPDLSYGERIVAKVVSNDSLFIPELIDFLSKRIDPYKIPSEIIVVDKLEKTATGKVLRNLGREVVKK